MSAAASLEASGLTIELYRNTIKAIEVLGRVNADKKVLFLFSDGQAEDKAYFHSDVINVARRQGGIINSLGFARSTGLSVSLQTLRRLSEESGGIYVAADTNYNLPGSFMSRPLANTDRGGRFIINLGSIADVSTGESDLFLRFSTSTQPITISFPVKLPEPEVEPITTQPVLLLPIIEQSQPAAPIAVREPDHIDYLLWYGVPGALLIMIILTLFTLYILYKKEKKDHPGNVTYAEVRPLAYLVSQDEKMKRIPCHYVNLAHWPQPGQRDDHG